MTSAVPDVPAGTRVEPDVPAGTPVEYDGAAGTLAERLVAELIRRGETVATAESLTGGLVGGALTDVPGVSAAYRGGLVVYATELKAELAGVPVELLEGVGPVHPETAAAMASGVRERLRATYGLSTTGVAGPDVQDGHPAGEVYIGVAGPDGVRTESLRLSGDRRSVRDAAVTALLELALRSIAAAA